MVVLGSQTEDTQGAVGVALHVFRVGVPEETLNGEFAPLDPDLSGSVHLVEDDRAAVGGRDDDARVIGRGARARVGLKFAVEELVEVLEILDGVEHFGHVELMEGDELGDLVLRSRVVVFDALFDAETTQELANWEILAMFPTTHRGNLQHILLFFSISLDFRPLYSSRIPSRT